MFREIKAKFETSDYLRKIDYSKFRNTIANLRMPSQNLNIETGRHRNILRSERKCSLCNLNGME